MPFRLRCELLRRELYPLIKTDGIGIISVQHKNLTHEIFYSI
jgi:hypothetical protein